jgi:hypothetical protein
VPVVLVRVVLWWYEGSSCGVHTSILPVPTARGAMACLLFSVRCAGVIVCGVWFSRALVVPCGSLMPLRHAKRCDQPTQPAVPADRFAREIVGFLAACAARLRQLNGKPLGGNRTVWSH